MDGEDCIAFVGLRRTLSGPSCDIDVKRLQKGDDKSVLNASEISLTILEILSVSSFWLSYVEGPPSDSPTARRENRSLGFERHRAFQFTNPPLSFDRKGKCHTRGKVMPEFEVGLLTYPPLSVYFQEERKDLI